MGRALIGGLLSSGVPAHNIIGSDKDPEQRQRTALQYGIELLEHNRDAIRDADVVVLAVKPQSMQVTVEQLGAGAGKVKPLLISIAAGVQLTQLDAWAGGDSGIVRAMPNTPALIQAGATALCGNQHVGEEQRDLAEAIMRAIGVVLWLEDEALMDVVTVLSGSGPAYYFLLMEILETQAVRLGLTQQQARLLTLQTAFGATKMALESEHDAPELRRQVTSPGGVTEQALETLTSGGLEALFADALEKARRRIAEISAAL